MTFTLAPGFQQSFNVSAVQADGTTPVVGTLGSLAFTTGGTFSALADPANPTGVIIACPAATSAGATDTCTATGVVIFADGTTQKFAGELSLVAGTTPPPPPPPVGLLAFTAVGSPVPIPASGKQPGVTITRG